MSALKLCEVGIQKKGLGELRQALTRAATGSGFRGWKAAGEPRVRRERRVELGISSGADPGRWRIQGLGLVPTTSAVGRERRRRSADQANGLAEESQPRPVAAPPTCWKRPGRKKGVGGRGEAAVSAERARGETSVVRGNHEVPSRACVAGTCHPSLWEVEAGRSEGSKSSPTMKRVRSLPGLLGTRSRIKVFPFYFFE